MTRRALLIAYHYPPVKVSSGIQRTLKFSQYLSDFGWRSTVLVPHPRVYPLTSDDQLGEIPADVDVVRGFALDTSRHLALRGSYPQSLALPDRWVSWWLGGVWAGLWAIRRQRPALIWSTYPIATAHLIGLTLQRLTGLPWIADCRDPMTEDDFPVNPQQRRAYRRLERKMVRRASRVVFTTPGTLRLYAERYPELPAQRWRLIANGFDEENFRQVERRSEQEKFPKNKKIKLIHSGLLYPQERDPRAFFSALGRLKSRALISATDLEVVLRASGHEDYHRQHIVANGIEDIVTLAPNIAYQAALLEMLDSDGLLLFQAANCNLQIPAKAYEYLRARRPILALTDLAGDTAGLLREAGIDSILPLDDAERIETGLERFLGQLRAGTAPLADAEYSARYSRYAATEELAALFEQTLAGG